MASEGLILMPVRGGDGHGQRRKRRRRQEADRTARARLQEAEQAVPERSVRQPLGQAEGVSTAHSRIGACNKASNLLMRITSLSAIAKAVS